MLAIADGVGSASHGGDAAALATRTCLDLRDIVDIPTLFREVDAKIQMAAKAESGQWSSTLSVCLIRDQHARFGHVGDTRIYHLRGKGLQTRTHDQTEVARLIEQGILTPERALRYPRRHVLVSVMNGTGAYELQQSGFELHDGDRVLLLSDGVYAQASKRDIANLSDEHSDVVDFIEALKELLLHRGLIDDASAICAQI